MTEDRALARERRGRGARARASSACSPCAATPGSRWCTSSCRDAIVLSTELPQLDGDAVLDHLKRHPETRHIPVYVLADAQRRARRAHWRARSAACRSPITPSGARRACSTSSAAFLDRRTRSVLVVEDDDASARRSIDLIGGADVKIVGGRLARGGAGRARRPRSFDCVVLDLGLEDGDGLRRCSRSSGAPSASAPAGDRAHAGAS